MQRPSPTDRQPAPTWIDIRAAAAPAVLIDPARRLIVDGNAAGLAAWWGGRPAQPMPQPLDAAMPALTALRQDAADTAGAEGRTDSLLLWAPGGVLRGELALQCAAAGGRVAVMLAARGGEGRPAPPLSGARGPGRGAKLAHELRTPLAAISAYAEAMAQEHFGDLGDARYRDYARIIQDSARHALGVVEGMLASAAQTTQRGLRELTFRDLDPAAIARSCVAVIAPAAEQAGVTLELEGPPGLPRIVADEVSVRQMLLNLLGNAVKFARPGDRVRLAVTHGTDGSLTFAVEDTGPGIAASREAGPASRACGLGVGLPLTRELAEANGAALAVESAPGCGTSARISFSPTRVVPGW